MSILIKGMEMPQTCWPCPFFHTSLHNIGDDELLERYVCLRTGERTEEYVTGRMSNCPLVPVPPHGRLIDADEMLKEHYNGNPDGSVFRASVIRPEMVEKLPTVIEAEEGET